MAAGASVLVVSWYQGALSNSQEARASAPLTCRHHSCSLCPSQVYLFELAERQLLCCRSRQHLLVFANVMDE